MPTKSPAIVDRTDPILRKTARAVMGNDITGKKIQDVLERMKAALASQDDGVAIAAPQIGESLRIFVVSKKVFKIDKEAGNDRDDLVFINPTITKLSRDKKEVPEGCLSVRYFYGNVLRSTKAVIEAWNEKGEKFERGASGLLAQIFQHETDHLNGILFIDKAKDLEEVPPETDAEKSGK